MIRPPPESTLSPTPPLSASWRTTAGRSPRRPSRTRTSAPPDSVSGPCRHHVDDLAPRPAAAPLAPRPVLAGAARGQRAPGHRRSEEHTAELQPPPHIVCRLL